MKYVVINQSINQLFYFIRRKEVERKTHKALGLLYPPQKENKTTKLEKRIKQN